MEFLDQAFALLVARMSLARKDQLKGLLACNREQARQVVEQQIRSFVARHASRKSQEWQIRAHLYSTASSYETQQIALGLLMRCPDVVVRQLVGMRQGLWLIAPIRELRVIDSGEARMSPGRGMNAIGDGAHAVSGKCPKGCFGMATRDPIYPTAEIECEKRHVEALVAAQHLELGKIDVIAQATFDEIEGKSVMTSPDRGVRREDAHLPDTYLVIDGLALHDVFRRAAGLVEELEGQEGRVPFIHVIGIDVEAKHPEHAHAADAQHNFLLESISGVAAIKAVGDSAVLDAVLLEIRIQQEKRYAVAERAGEGMEPWPNPDLTSFDRDRDHCLERHGPSRRIPWVREVDLASSSVDSLL